MRPYSTHAHNDDLLCQLDKGAAKKGDLILLMARTMAHRPKEDGLETSCYLGTLTKYENNMESRITLDGCIILRPTVEISGIGSMPNIDFSQSQAPLLIKQFSKFYEWRFGKDQIFEYLAAKHGFELYAPLVPSISKAYKVTMQALQPTAIHKVPSKANTKVKGFF